MNSSATHVEACKCGFYQPNVLGQPLVSLQRKVVALATTPFGSSEKIQVAAGSYACTTSGGPVPVGWEDQLPLIDLPCETCLCPVGRYAPSYMSTGACESCPDGKSVVAGAGTSKDDCDECPPGYYADHTLANMACTACPAGKYTNNTKGNTKCTLCEPNKYSAEVANYVTKIQIINEGTDEETTYQSMNPAEGACIWCPGQPDTWNYDIYEVSATGATFCGTPTGQPTSIPSGQPTRQPTSEPIYSALRAANYSALWRAYC